MPTARWRASSPRATTSPSRCTRASALEEADRRKDEFLATLAHELRNPLAPIRQAALLARSAAAPTRRGRPGRWT